MVFDSLEQANHLVIIDHMDSKHQNKIFQKWVEVYILEKQKEFRIMGVCRHY